MSGTIARVEGDTLDEVAFTYADIGEGEDLNDFQSIRLLVQLRDDVLVKDGQIVDGTAGTFRVTWDEDDVTEGTYPAQVELINEAGLKITFYGLTVSVVKKITP